MYPQDFLFIFHGFLCVLVYGSSISHTRRGLGAGVTQVVDFDCPEEFGYYPHPTDCTQYYVCVFGGALLESCTGGLMYSHELQTCDWPRNVGCGESHNANGGTISTVRVTDPRTRNPQQSQATSGPQQNPAMQSSSSRNSQRQEYGRPRQQEIVQQQLYAEDIGPAEEIESDRQQRVYRGQPSTVGQVQRDRDGLRTLKSNVHAQNVIPTGSGDQDKISVVSFGSQRPSAPRPQEQYRNLTIYLKDNETDSIPDEKTDDLTKEIRSRTRRQVVSRVEQVQGHQLTSALPPLPPTPRPIEQYNTSQRFPANQFDQYYTVFDDVDIYRRNEYGQQYQSPSSTPSGSIAHQYRGQTTHKQVVELEQPIQSQQHRNAYDQDIYSPPPVLQDYNDQYNVQIDEQQYQQLTQTTPKLSSRSETTNSSKDALTESSSTSVTRAPENATNKTESSSPTIRRSDGNSFFSISSFGGPSTVLLPPLRFHETTQKYLESTYPSPKTERPLYSSIIPALRDGGKNNFEPPKNGGALAKTFNNFDSLLTSFIAAVTKGNTVTETPSPSTTPPTPHPPKTSPETIVRSEIGRIHHDPVVITENFTIRQPLFRKPEGPGSEKVKTTVVATLPPASPSSTPVPPPKLSQNDYLAYFVEIEPKKPKQEGRGFYSKTSAESPDGYTESDNKPPGSFVRFFPATSVQNGRQSTQASETTIKTQERKSSPRQQENTLIEKQRIIGPITTVGQPYHPVGKWVIAKDENPKRFQNAPNSFETYSQIRSREPLGFGGTTEVTSSNTDRGPDAPTHKETENFLPIHGSAEPDIPRTTVVAGPYKFLYVDLSSTTEHLPTPTPFERNPENEERNRFSYKTNPESRVKVRYFDTSRDTGQNKESSEASTEVIPSTYAPDVENKDRIKYIYKTNPESRIRSRYLESSPVVLDDEKTEDPRVAPKIIVPEMKPEEAPPATLEEKPIQVLPRVPDVPEQPLSKRRKTEYGPKTSEPEQGSRKPYRYRPTTEIPEKEPISEEPHKPSPRRVIKVHRGELKSQRLTPVTKLKRFRKPVAKSASAPIVVLEDLEEKTFSKENEIHPPYRPIVVTEALYPNKTHFRFTVEEERDFADAVSNNKILPVVTTEKYIPETASGGYDESTPVPPDTENDVPDKEIAVSEKPYTPILKRPHVPKNVTQFENRATTKAYRGKFKPSDTFKLRLRPTTATPDSESTPGPHLSTRQPGGYTIGSTGNEVTSVSISRGTPSPNRGTRPTLKPSTAIVSKASDFIDIYRYPPSRPQNLYATPTPDKSAAKCRKDVCLLPDCNCGGKDIPGGYAPEEIPQLVLLTFDDSVNDLNKGLYADLFERGRVNPNGCPISATFYVSHEWTDYSQVQNLYANGHEIASHSITHSFGEQFSQKKWMKEIAGQREILAAYGGVRLEDIRGMRAPFLAVGGNKMFKMLYDSNFTYDSSMPIYENRPPSWPYTLDYKLFHDCMIPPCPTKSYPGVWEVPMVMWQDLNGGRCSMGDACSNPPTADGVYKMLIKNFERHFTTNRAPFGLYYHAAWFTHEHHKEGFIAFLDTIVNMPEVWLVTTWQAIEWVRDPQPLSTVQNFPPFQCNVEKARRCNNPKVCNLWHKSGVRYMRTCQPCPEVYPWTGKTGVKNSRVDNEIIDE